MSSITGTPVMTPAASVVDSDEFSLISHGIAASHTGVDVTPASPEVESVESILLPYEEVTPLATKINDTARFPKMTLVTFQHHGDQVSNNHFTLIYSQKIWEELSNMGSEDSRRCIHKALENIASKDSGIQELLFVAIFANSKIRRILVIGLYSEENLFWGLVRTLALKTLAQCFGEDEEYLIRVDDVKGENKFTKMLLEKSHGRIHEVNGKLLWGHGEVYDGKTFLVYKTKWDYAEVKYNIPETAERAIAAGCGKELPVLVI